jgi:HAD superfamily hydrolase (TIGR01549 family)
MKLAAVIFDLDGTLIDTEDAWGRAFAETLRSLGARNVDDHPEEFGLPIDDNWRMLLVKYKITTDKKIDELRTITYQNYVKTLREVTLIEGAKDFLDSLKGMGIKIALATNCEWWVVEKIFDYLGLNEFFDATVMAEETSNQKPAPEALLLASDKLGELPGNCLVVGDSLTDVEAAKHAGMKVAIIDSSKREKWIKGADLTVGSFSEITPEAIDQL